MRNMFLLVVISLSLSYGGENSANLLPEKMIFTQRILWGEGGLMRRTNLVELNRDNRYTELEVRNRLFIGHKVLGYITLAEMLGAGIVGWQVYDGNYDLLNLHKGLLVATNITYFAGLSIALFSPPPKSNKNNSFGLTAHKVLSTVHLLGMISTDILGGISEGNSSLKKAHKITGITTFASLALATIIINF